MKEFEDGVSRRERRRGTRLQRDVLGGPRHQDAGRQDRHVHREGREGGGAEAAALDEEFARGFGIADGNIDALRTEVRANMERELADGGPPEGAHPGAREACTRRIRSSCRGAGRRADPGIAGGDAASRGRQGCQTTAAARAVRAAGPPPRGAGPAHERAGAHRGIKVSREAGQEKLNELAASYSNPDEVRRAYLQNADMMRQIESQVLEAQAIDWMMARPR